MGATSTDLDWTVISVFDPDGKENAFAYTVGLWDKHDLPELHVWAQPTHGADPGDGWAWSSRDMCNLLNDFARQLIDGAVGPGSVSTGEYDGGFTTVDFVLGEPVAPDDVDAFQAPPGAIVIPVQWSLRRPTLSDSAVGLSPVDRERAAETASVYGAYATAPWPGAEAYGPWTPVVTALRGAIASNVVGVAEAVGNLVYSDGALSLGSHAVAIARAAARAVGRVEACARAEAAADEDAVLLTAALADDPEWDITAGQLQALERRVTAILRGTYTSWVVLDALDAKDPLLGWHGIGTFDVALQPAVAGERLLAHPDARSVIDRAVAAAAVDPIAFDEVAAIETAELEDTTDLVELRGWGAVLLGVGDPCGPGLLSGMSPHARLLVIDAALAAAVSWRVVDKITAPPLERFANLCP